MIQVICTQCRAQLEMDDAFAGGVCRCQYCGTIQTVPSLSKLKRQMAPAGAMPPAPAVTPASPQPHGSASPTSEPSGLDALAEAVASSSGLGRSSLRSGPTRPPSKAPAPPETTLEHAPPAGAIPVEYARPAQQKRRQKVLIAGAAVAGGALVALGAMIFSGAHTTTTTPLVGPTTAGGTGTSGQGGKTPDGPGADGGRVVIPSTPHFCGIDLRREPSVVYLLDRGNATAVMFDALKQATFRSAESLKPDQKFAIVFWSTSAETARYPAEGMADVRITAIEEARRQFAEVFPGGAAEPHDALRAAAALRPAVVVLVTGKAFSLEEDLVDLCRELFPGKGTRVHTVALGSDDGSTVLKRIAQATGGESRVVTKPQLDDYAN